jgi:hypothetical protein
MVGGQEGKTVGEVVGRDDDTCDVKGEGGR